MGFLSKIFGGGDDEDYTPAPLPPPTPVADPDAEPPKRGDVDPNMDEMMAGAHTARRKVLSRRGRSSLVTGRPTGVSIVGGD